MHAEDLVVDHACDGEAVEGVAEQPPHFDVISPLTLVVETVDPVDGSTFVVASHDEKVLRKLDLVGHQQRNGLYTLLAPIHVVTNKDRKRGRRGVKRGQKWNGKKRKQTLEKDNWHREESRRTRKVARDHSIAREYRHKF